MIKLNNGLENIKELYKLNKKNIDAIDNITDSHIFFEHCDENIKDSIVKSIIKDITLDTVLTPEKAFPYDKQVIKDFYEARKKDGYGTEDGYYYDSMTRQMRHYIGFENYYSWEDFCDKYNLNEYKIDSINEKMVLYSIKLEILKYMLRNSCEFLGHNYVESKRQPDYHINYSTYQGIRDVECYRTHYNYDCSLCNHSICESVPLDLASIHRERNKHINSEEVQKPFIDSIPSAEKTYNDSKKDIKVYGLRPNFRETCLFKDKKFKLGDLMKLY